MSTFVDRLKTALIVIDVQEGVVRGAYQRDAVVVNIARLVEKARMQDAPVIWVRHSSPALAIGGGDWQIVSELVPRDTEPIVEKLYGDSFEDTNLAEILSELTVGRLIVVGALTDACVQSTLYGALVRGFDTILVGDAHTTRDRTAWSAPTADKIIAHTNQIWSYQRAPGRVAGTVTTDEVDFATKTE